jgi:hypothetical protein
MIIETYHVGKHIIASFESDNHTGQFQLLRVADKNSFIFYCSLISNFVFLVKLNKTRVKGNVTVSTMSTIMSGLIL